MAERKTGRMPLLPTASGCATLVVPHLQRNAEGILEGCSFPLGTLRQSRAPVAWRGGSFGKTRSRPHCNRVMAAYPPCQPAIKARPDGPFGAHNLLRAGHAVWSIKPHGVARYATRQKNDTAEAEPIAAAAMPAAMRFGPQDAASDPGDDVAAPTDRRCPFRRTGSRNDGIGRHARHEHARRQASFAQPSQSEGVCQAAEAGETVEAMQDGPMEPRSTVLIEASDALAVVFRRHRP